ncbi:glycoside hydrolase family 26 protein [Tenuibacillus multivorans]|uniref:glycoside hydrolase family 26 protein n=1 Tax=Tenuibacillus multivorans TaxID=237069 RepID=UPI0016498810|nr:glycosyl hydrolase [Tenuibacillus multivorans]
MKNNQNTWILFAIIPLLTLLTSCGMMNDSDTSNNHEGQAANAQSSNWADAARKAMNTAEHYKDQEQYNKSKEYYIKAAEYFEQANMPSWTVQSNIYADFIDTDVTLYVEQPVKQDKNLGKFEPESGTYLGFFMAGSRETNRPDLMDDIYGRNHAIYLTYTKWGQHYEETDSYFPLKFAENAKKYQAGIQIGFEPSEGLDQVVDGEYIRQFAREAKESGVPVFLRYASEMNGEWVPWSGDPEKYKEKFRLVHDIMEKEAPNVAMVWSPNFLPRHNIDQYYPGDEYVDWVGTSLYTIPFSHGERKPGGNPIDYLRPIYEKYSHKPMMVSEGAVSHYSYELDEDFSEWAASQIGNMYGFLPRMFPNIKAVTYFNLDKITTNYDNQNNNYDLADNKQVDKTYQRMIQNGQFIDQLTVEGAKTTIETQFLPVQEVKQVNGEHDTFLYVKLPEGEQPYYVAVYQGDKKLGESYAQPWNMRIDFSKVDPNRPLTLIAFDREFKRLATEKVEVSF